MNFISYIVPIIKAFSVLFISHSEIANNFVPDSIFIF